MRATRIFILAAALILSLAPQAAAHRVNVFAFVDGQEIQVECGFNRGAPVKGGVVEVLAEQGGAVLLSGQTDASGVFRFPIPEGARGAGGLLIRVNAGEGHQGEWLISAAALGQSAATEASPPAPEARAAPEKEVKSLSLSPGELEEIINAALEQKIAPLREMLAEQYKAGPSWREIIGGIGWLVGLAGLAAYFRSRRSPR